jgi:hypothetical protein
MYAQRFYPNMYMQLSGDEIDNIIEGELQDAEVMGYDIENNPELMGAWLKNLIGKIKAKVQAKRAAKSGGGYSIAAPFGTANYDPATGLSFTNNQTPNVTPDTSIQSKLKDPKMLAIGAAAILAIAYFATKKK